jgi:predicted nucleic acid-binding protein
VTIAAVALAHQVPLLTDNRKHFPMPELQLLPMPELQLLSLPDRGEAR